MANNAKKYIITAVTLGVVAAASSCAIALINLWTHPIILENEKNAFNRGIEEIFEENHIAEEKNDIEKHPYAKKLYDVYLVTYSETEGEEDPQEIKTLDGWAIRADGSNNYGKISLIVGFDLEKTFKGIYMISDGQTYASTLEDKYVDPLNNGTADYNSKTDVSCGATYGAKLVQAMIKDAKSYVDGIVVS